MPSAKEVSDQMVQLLVEEYGEDPEEAEEFVGAIRQAAMHEMRERCVARCHWLATYEHDLSPDHRIGDGSPDAIHTAAEYVSVIPYDDDAWRELRDADLRKLARLRGVDVSLLRDPEEAMSAATRQALGRLREKYARVFGLELDEVQTEEWADGQGRVWAPRWPRCCPVWTLDESEAAHFGAG